jgi:RHS repeat-associated protein
LISAGDAKYKYNSNGNLVKEQNGADTKEYKYDMRNQLSEVDYQDGTYVKYGYDAAGRKVYREVASVELSKLNEKDKTNNGNGNSNKDKDNTNNGKGNDKISENGNNGNGNGNGKYDNPGQGNKYGVYKDDLQKLPMQIEKTRYTYEGLTSTLYKEYSDKGSPYAEYYNANNQIISKKMFGLHGMITPGQEDALKTNGGLMYYQYNGSNTVSELTNRNGDEIEHYRYDAFGNILTGITAPYNSTTYTGQQYDDKAGLLYMNARWYNPGIGRFLTEDTYPGTSLNPQSQNRYSYVMNNPVNMWDPTGNIPWWVGQDFYLTWLDNGNYLNEA